MLQTQVAYWANKETARHNLVTEKQTDTDLARKQAELNQTIKYQAEQVQYWKDQLAELNRHNLVTEGLTAEELKTKKAQAAASLKQAEAALQNAETNRKDLANKAKQASAAITTAKANKMRAYTDSYESSSRREKNRAEASKSAAQAGTERIRRDTYLWSDVVLPTVKSLLPW